MVHSIMQWYTTDLSNWEMWCSEQEGICEATNSDVGQQQLQRIAREIGTNTHWDEPTENITYLEYVANIIKEEKNL